MKLPRLQRERAVDAAYGKTGFKTEAERVAFLFERYQQLTAPLGLVEKPAKRGGRKSSTERLGL